MAAAFLIALVGSLILIGISLMGWSPWAAIAVPFGVIGLVLSVLWPQIPILGLVALIPLDFLAVIPGAAKAVSLFKILFLISMTILAFRYAVRAERLLPPNATDLWLGVWALYNAGLLLLAEDRAVALDVFRRDMSMWLFYFVLSRLFVEPAWQKRILVVILVTVSISVLIGIQNYVTGENPFAVTEAEMEDSDEEPGPYWSAGPVRITGASDVNSNGYACMLFLPLAVSSFLAVTSSGRRKALASLVVLLMATGLVLTYSRSAFLVTVVLLLLFLVRVRMPLRKMLLVGLLGILCLPFVPGDYWHRIGTLVSGHARADESLWRRSHYLTVGWNILKEHPVFGCGPGNYQVLHANARFQDEPSQIGVQRVAHNVYLTMLTETGIVGLMIFLGLMGSFVLDARRIAMRAGAFSPLANGLYVSLLSLLTMGLFLSLEVEKYLWLILGLIRAISAGAGVVRGRGTAPEPGNEPTAEPSTPEEMPAQPAIESTQLGGARLG